VGQQSLVDDRRIRRTGGYGVIALAALAAIAVLLGASMLNRPANAVTAGTQADSLVLDSLDVFGAGTDQQVAASTVINTGRTPVSITGVRITSRTGTVTGMRVFPGENCGGTTISAGGYCVVSVVDNQGSPAAFADYHITSDGCTGKSLLIDSEEGVQPDCAIGVTDTPGAAGSRPAYLAIAYCGQPAVIEGHTHTPIGKATPAALPNDPAPGCPDQPGVTALHVLVSLTGTGIGTATPPPLSPAGRTTLVSGTGFPHNATVTPALVPLGTSSTTDPTTVPGFATATTDGSGTFGNQLMLVMPHTTPGQYEILAQAPAAAATVGFLVTPGTQEPSKFVTRH
jgi:hypothetical protein